MYYIEDGLSRAKMKKRENNAARISSLAIRRGIWYYVRGKIVMIYVSVSKQTDHNSSPEFCLVVFMDEISITLMLEQAESSVLYVCSPM